METSLAPTPLDPPNITIPISVIPGAELRIIMSGGLLVPLSHLILMLLLFLIGGFLGQGGGELVSNNLGCLYLPKQVTIFILFLMPQL